MYSFNTLDDKEFERLVRDILSRKLNKEFQIFKKGKDKGIDLRYSSDGENIIVQVKHYANSKFSDLKYKLANEEKAKMDILKPDRYILATSLPLSPQETDEILSIMYPYILNTNDIYGKDIINEFLTDRNNSDIEEKYNKLWLSSTNILERIANKGSKFISDFYKEKIERISQLFVYSKLSYGQAIEILNKERFLIIKGEPGVGKTTLANMLLYDYLGKDFELLYITDKIRDGGENFNLKPGVNEVIFFDDFLGSNYNDLYNYESSLLSFIERALSYPSKRLIFTTRTIVLNKAKSFSEKIERANFNIAEFEIYLRNYTRLEKAKILYKHLFFRSVKTEFRQQIAINQNYLRIIDHKNFTPRIIEYITDESKLIDISNEEYFNFILDQLNNPKEIWRKPFLNQLEPVDRILLTTLFSLGDSIPDYILQKAFEKRLSYEIKYHNLNCEDDVYNNCLKRLLNGFLKSYRNEEKLFYSLINPSVGDFLINYFNNSRLERAKILKSIVYYEQFKRFNNSTNSILLENDEKFELSIYVKKSIHDLSFYTTILGDESIEKIDYLLSIFSFPEIEEVVIDRMKNMDIKNIHKSQITKLYKLLYSYNFSEEVFQFLNINFDELINKILTNTPLKELDEVRYLFDILKKDFDDFLKKQSNTVIQSILENTVEEYFETIDYINYESILEENGINKDRIIEQFHDKLPDFINDSLSDYNLDFLEERIENIDLYSIIEYNITNDVIERVIDDAHDSYRSSESNIEDKSTKDLNLLNEEDEINYLFE